MLGDVQIAEPGALICFAGPRVIEQTIREKLPEGFQRAEYLLDHGMLDRVVARKDLRDELVTHPAPADQPAARRAGRPARPRPAPAPPADAPRNVTRAADPTPVLERLIALHPKVIDLTLDRVERLLAALGHPERRLPPVIHVAGTNGKGSTAAMLRAGLEARGRPRPRLHLAAPRALPRAHPPRRRADRRRPTSPRLLDDCEAANARRADHLLRDHHRRGLPRLRARPRPTGRCSRSASAAGSTPPTSIDRPRLTVITPVSLDHQQYLGETLRRDRRREGRHPQARRPLRRRPARSRRGAGGDRGDAPRASARRCWSTARTGRSGRNTAAWSSRTRPACSTCRCRNLLGAAPDRTTPASRSPRCAPSARTRPPASAAVTGADWPARMQRLRRGPLVEAAGQAELWLDGGHNPAAGRGAGRGARPACRRARSHLICGMLRTKDVAGFLRPLAARRPQRSPPSRSPARPRP